MNWILHGGATPICLWFLIVVAVVLAAGALIERRYLLAWLYGWCAAGFDAAHGLLADHGGWLASLTNIVVTLAALTWIAVAFRASYRLLRAAADSRTNRLTPHHPEAEETHANAG